MKYDIIIANPPYNSGGTARNKALWPLFLKTSLDCLKDNGHFSFLIPSSWAAVDADFLNTRASIKSVTYAKANMLTTSTPLLINFGDRVNNHFKVGVDISLITGIKAKGNYNTRINTNAGSVNLDINRLPFIPLNINDTILGILTKTQFTSELFKAEVGCYRKKIKNSETTNIVKSDTYRYPYVTTSSKYSKNIYGYSISECIHQFKPKVIWSTSGYTKAFSDTGKFGLGNHTAAICISTKHHKSLIWYLEKSKLIKLLASFKKGGGFIVGYASIIHRIPKITLIDNMTDEYVFKYFNLTEEEINFIENEI